jgi:hypothetical protein
MLVSEVATMRAAVFFAAILLGAAVARPAAAVPSVVGPGAWTGPPVMASPYFYPYAPYAYPAVPYAYGPEVYGPSYFRPLAPYGWNPNRNWRDTWQDDGVKVHGYTFR